MAIVKHLIINGAYQTDNVGSSNAWIDKKSNIADTSGAILTTTVNQITDNIELTSTWGSYANGKCNSGWKSAINATGYTRLKVKCVASTQNKSYIYVEKFGNNTGTSGVKGTVPTSRNTITIDISGLPAATLSNLQIYFYIYKIAPQSGGTYKWYIEDMWLERDEQTYTISYANGNHGTPPTAQTKTEGVDLTLRGAITTTDTYNGTTSNYTVTGNANGGEWASSGTKNGTATKTPVYYYKQTKWKATNGTTYNPGGAYKTDAATTMTAQWGQGDLKNTNYTYTLPTNKPTKASSTTDSKVVTFNANGGITSKFSETSSKTVTYTFNNTWKTSDGTTRTSTSQISANETIYAQYNSTAGSQSSITFPTTTQCTRTGYTLLGWSTSDSATTPTYEPGATRVPTSASEIYYAVWKLNSRLFVNTSRVTSIKIGTQDVKKLLVNNLTIFEK